MNMLIASIQDSATELYSPPMFFRTEMEAKRMFINEVNNKESRINRNPEDYALYSVGIWNDEAGEIQGTKPTKLLRAQDVIKGEQK